MTDPPGRPRAALDDVVVYASNGSVQIDLSRLPWCDPLHLVAVAALARYHVAAGAAVHVRAPADPDARAYAARMRLGRTLDGLATRHEFPSVRERDRSGDLLEVCPVRDEQEALRLARLVARRARPADRDASSTLFACVVEMALNVAEHAGVTGYVAAQTLPRQGWMRFAVADTGLGLQATLAARGATDDASAVRLALSGASRLPGPQRGTGLPTTRRELLRADGWLLVASGAASLLAETGGDAMRTQRPGFPGTLVQGALRIDHRVDTQE